MAKTFTATRSHLFANRVISWLAQRGIGTDGTTVLTVPGRVTGEPRSTPVLVTEHGGARHLVAPHGEVDWVKNARAAGRVRLQRGRTVERLRVTELPPAQAAPVLRAFVGRVRVVRPYFDTAPGSPLEAFEAEAPGKPVFRLDPV